MSIQETSLVWVTLPVHEYSLRFQYVHAKSERKRNSLHIFLQTIHSSKIDYFFLNTKTHVVYFTTNSIFLALNLYKLHDREKSFWKIRFTSAVETYSISTDIRITRLPSMLYKIQNISIIVIFTVLNIIKQRKLNVFQNQTLKSVNIQDHISNKICPRLIYHTTKE